MTGEVLVGHLAVSRAVAIPFLSRAYLPFLPVSLRPAFSGRLLLLVFFVIASAAGVPELLHLPEHPGSPEDPPRPVSVESPLWWAFFVSASAAGAWGLPHPYGHPGSPSGCLPRATAPSVFAVCLVLVGLPLFVSTAGVLMLLHPQKHLESRLVLIRKVLSFFVNLWLLVGLGRVSQVVALARSFRGQWFVSLVQGPVLFVEQLRRWCLVSRHPVRGVHRH